MGVSRKEGKAVIILALKKTRYVQHEFEKTIKGFSVHGEIFYSCGEENGIWVKGANDILYLLSDFYFQWYPGLVGGQTQGPL